jgi:hypothetical protein
VEYDAGVGFPDLASKMNPAYRKPGLSLSVQAGESSRRENLKDEAVIAGRFQISFFR